DGYRTLPFPYRPIAAPPFAMTMQWNAHQFLAYLRSWSATQHFVRARGIDPVAVVEDELLAAWGPPQASREVRWEFHLRCGRVEAVATATAGNGIGSKECA